MEVKKISTSLTDGVLSREQARKKLLDFIQKQRKELESGQEFLNSVGKK